MERKERPLYIYGKRWYHLLKGSKEHPTASYLLKDYEINDIVRHLVVCLIPNKLPWMKEPWRTQKGKMKHLFAYFDSYLEFFNYMANFKRKDRNFFEVIFGELPQKPHFDIDIAADELENNDKLDDIGDLLYQAVIQGCIEVCHDCHINIDLEKDVLLYSSHGETKRSYHVLLNNKCHDGNAEAKAFYQAVLNKISTLISNKKYLSFIDNAVYGPRQQFRMMGCQKYGTNRPKIFHESFIYRGITYKHKYIEDVTDENSHKLAIMYESLISFVSGCTFLPSLVPPKPIYNNIIPDVDDEIVNKCIKMMKNTIPNCPFTAYKVQGGLILLKRNSPSSCPLCNKVHENQDPYIYVVNNKVFWDCRRTAEGKPKLFLGYLTLEDVTIEVKSEKMSDKSEESDGEGVFMFGDYDITKNNETITDIKVEVPVRIIVEIPVRKKEIICDIPLKNRTTKNVLTEISKTANYKQNNTNYEYDFSLIQDKIDFSSCKK